MSSAYDDLLALAQTATEAAHLLERGDNRQARVLFELLASRDKRWFDLFRIEIGSTALTERMRSFTARATAIDIDSVNDVNQLVKEIIAALSYVRVERFVGYKLEQFKRSFQGQANYLSDLVEGITTEQATTILGLAFEADLDILIGGSALMNNCIGGDLDIGFKQSNIPSKGQDISSVHERVITVVNRINKLCFKWYQHIFHKPLVPHKWLHDKSAVAGIPDIDTVEEFFMRRGFRSEPRVVEKDGKSFGPSGYALFETNGSITIVTPRYKKSVVGELRFWS